MILLFGWIVALIYRLAEYQPAADRVRRFAGRSRTRSRIRRSAR